MAPPDQGGGASPPAAAALRRQTSSCTYSSRDEPVQLERRVSCSSASFSSPSSSASTAYHPAASSNKSSCESIPFADPELLVLGKQSSSSSASSYESFFHYVDPDHDDCSKYLDFEQPPATRAPGVQSMTAAATECCAAYDPKRLPSAMFRSRSTSPAEWSITSNESLFSIRLSNSGDSGDLYYDAAGFPRFPSVGSDTSSQLMRTPSVPEGIAGGLCLRGDCARCSINGATRKSVRFATAESVSGGSTHSAVYPARANVHEPAACTAKTSETAARWCQFGCCWPSLPTIWWPRCCAWHCHCCDCRC